MTVASVDDVAISLGRSISSGAEIAQISRWLRNAEMQIRLRLGDVADLDQEALIFVETESVVLKVRNPDGKKSESVDDYSYGRYEDAARGQVSILDEWWDLLSPDVATGAFTITPYAQTDESWYEELGWSTA